MAVVGAAAASSRSSRTRTELRKMIPSRGGGGGVRGSKTKAGRPSDASPSPSPGRKAASRPPRSSRRASSDKAAEEMEYSTLGGRGSGGGGGASSSDSVTSAASQGRSKDADGAAAMAVEYGVGEDHFIGVIDESKRFTPPKPRRPRMRSLERWDSDKDFSTVKTPDENELHDSEHNMSDPARPSKSSLRSPQPTTSQSCSNISNLQVLGLTVQAVNQALQRCAPRKNGGGHAFHLSSVRFHPQGCVWDALLHVNDGLEVPVEITCCCDEEANGQEEQDYKHGDPGSDCTVPRKYAIELSLKELCPEKGTELVLALHWVKLKVNRSLHRVGLGDEVSLKWPNEISIATRTASSKPVIDSPSTTAVLKESVAAEPVANANRTVSSPGSLRRDDRPPAIDGKPPSCENEESLKGQAKVVETKEPEHVMPPKVVDVCHHDVPMSILSCDDEMGVGDESDNRKTRAKEPRGPLPECGPPLEMPALVRVPSSPEKSEKDKVHAQNPPVPIKGHTSSAPKSAFRNSGSNKSSPKATKLEESVLTGLTASITTSTVVKSSHEERLLAPIGSGVMKGQGQEPLHLVHDNFSAQPTTSSKDCTRGDVPSMRRGNLGGVSSNRTSQGTSGVIRPATLEGKHHEETPAGLAQELNEIQRRGCSMEKQEAKACPKGNNEVGDLQKAAENMESSTRYSAGEIRMAKRGLISQKSMVRLSSSDIASSSSVEVDDEDASPNANKLRLYGMGLMNVESTPHHLSNQNTETGGMGQQKEPHISSPTNIESGNGTTESCLVPEEVISNMRGGHMGIYSAGEVRMASKGLMSQKSMRRLSNEGNTPAALKSSRENEGSDESDRNENSSLTQQGGSSGGTEAKNLSKLYMMGLMREKSIRQMGLQQGGGPEEHDDDGDDDDDDVSLDFDEVKVAATEQHIDLAKAGLLSGESMARLGINKADLFKASRGFSEATLIHSNQKAGVAETKDDKGPPFQTMNHGCKNSLDLGELQAAMDKSNEDSLRSLRAVSSLNQDSLETLQAISADSLDLGKLLTQKDIEQAKLGLLSMESLTKLGISRADLYKAISQSDSSKEQPRAPATVKDDVGSNDAKEKTPQENTGNKYAEIQLRMAQLGCLSKKSMANFREKGVLESSNSGISNVSENDDQQRQKEKSSEHCPEGELRMAQLGCVSKKSMENFRRKGVIRRSSSKVSFSDGRESSWRDDVDDDPVKSPLKVEEPKASAAALATNKDDDTDEEEEESPKDVLVFSSNELEKRQSDDILTEGQYYLGISMLVYMYSHLRETCRMGHTRVKMEDIDVHSLQSQYKGRSTKKYLKSTKTAGAIIRVVIDELDGVEDDEDHDIVGDENKEYERSITAQFRSWIEDSRVNQLDEETRKMIIEMKRKVARHRWKRAISAVRLSYRISGGKRPKFEAPVAAPGCENQNRFVDMNNMMSEAMRTQPKYFREGSVMHNLIESGIELVWFSDMSQNDVVYGICIERELKKITVVFRGTVNAHNWKMNLKFDTNEYRNPVKQNYPGRVDELSLHSGFALYLLRKRKDTGISKLQEIFDKIDEIGREMSPDGNFKLSITGHSLGGALATLFGFYVAARSRFAHLSTIYVWTFAAPRVGTQAFMHAWQHLERTGRIRHARFSATHDLVPLVPFCNFEMNDLQFYKHVGVRVQLHGVGRIGKWRLRNKLDVTYPLRHDWSSEVRRMLMNNIFANLTTLPGFKNNHKLTEYQKRLHFAMSYRRALGSGELFSDPKRKRIKSLDEYYRIRAKITSEGIDQHLVEENKPSEVRKDISRPVVLFLVLLLVTTYVLLILSVSTDIFETHQFSIHCVGVPFTRVASGIWHMALLPVTLPGAIYATMCSQARRAMNAIIPTHHVSNRNAFVGRRYNHSGLNNLMSELAIGRANHYTALHHQMAFSSARQHVTNGDSTKFAIFESTANGLFSLAALVDDGVSPQLTIAAPTNDDEQAKLVESSIGGKDQDLAGDVKERTAALQALETKLLPLQEYATGVTFAPKIDEGLYLVGAGVRKKSIVKVYAVAMYSSAAVLDAASSRSALGNAARLFDSLTPTTSFVLEMVYSVGAEKIAGAIAESLKPRYPGSPSNINALELLIVQGVNKIGGQATKGTVFRFDCSLKGVSVSVDGTVQGIANFDGMGSSFVDVFMDDSTVSPTLVESCIETWSDPKQKAISSSLLEFGDLMHAAPDGSNDEEQPVPKEDNSSSPKRQVIESRMKPLKDYATSVEFEPKLDEGLYLIGVGVRKKSIVSVYAVSMYSSPAVIEALSPFSQDKSQKKDASSALHVAARTFDSFTPTTVFVLEMVYSASAEKIASAIADNVKPRYDGSPSDVGTLESLIIEGVNIKGGQASKGTIFRFDCSNSGVGVSVDGKYQGMASFEGMGSAFVDVFMDGNAVSPTLIGGCLDTWTAVAH